MIVADVAPLFAAVTIIAADADVNLVFFYYLFVVYRQPRDVEKEI